MLQPAVTVSHNSTSTSTTTNSDLTDLSEQSLISFFDTSVNNYSISSFVDNKSFEFLSDQQQQPITTNSINTQWDPATTFHNRIDNDYLDQQFLNLGDAGDFSKSLTSPGDESVYSKESCSTFNNYTSQSAPNTTVMSMATLEESNDHNIKNKAYSETNSPSSVSSNDFTLLKNDVNNDNSDAWSPLFSQQELAANTCSKIESSPIESTTVSETKHTESTPESSPKAFEVASKIKLASITKKKKNASPALPVSASLPPVVVKNPNDAAAVRRAKNTEAARRSRAKKNERIDQLEELVSELMSKNSMLEAENVILRKFHQLPGRTNE